jgi:hypothetical protein
MLKIFSEKTDKPYCNWNIFCNKTKIAEAGESSFTNETHFYPLKEYKEKFKGVYGSSLWNLMVQITDKCQGTYVCQGTNTIMLSHEKPSPGWVVLQSENELVKYNHHNEKITLKSIWFSHATRFVNREDARKVAKLCSGKVLRFSEVQEKYDKTMKLGCLIGTHLNKIDHNNIDYILLGRCIEGFKLLGYRDDYFRHTFSYLWLKWEEFNDLQPVI